MGIAEIGRIETERDKHGREGFYFKTRDATNIFSPEDKYREYTDHRVVSLANERNTRVLSLSLSDKGFRFDIMARSKTEAAIIGARDQAQRAC